MANAAARHDVASPTDIPWSDWRPILKRVWERTNADNVGMLAAGVAFYGFLAVFPAIAAGLMTWGLFVDASSLQAQVTALEHIAPSSIFELLYNQMVRIAGQTTENLQLGVLVTLLLALWSSSRGVTALMQALNMAYREQEKRSFVRVNLIAIVFTLVGIGFVALSLAAIAAVPPILESLFLGAFAEAMVHIARWLLLLGVFLAAAAMIYRFAPSRVKARWRWIMPGAVAASLLWLIATLTFSFILANFNSYNATFGSLGAVAALLMWFWLSAYAICMGAELNSQIELFTTRDTTIGAPTRKGKRGAYVADHVESPEAKTGPTPPAPPPPPTPPDATKVPG